MKGHSGSAVILKQNPHGDRYIKKWSPNPRTNLRFKNQLELQRTFQSDIVKTPEIYDIKHDQQIDCLKCTMEYIPGHTLYQLFETRPWNEIKPVIEKIAHYLCEIRAQAQTVDLQDYEHTFIDKINSIELNTDLEHKVRDAVIDRIKHASLTLHSTRCHGDLTFENIIVQGSDVFFIDFLDNYMPCVEQDLGKLFQDVLHFWSWRDKQHKPVAKCKAAFDVFSYYIDDHDTIDFCETLSIINILRAVPYNPNCAYIDNILQEIWATH